MEQALTQSTAGRRPVAPARAAALLVLMSVVISLVIGYLLAQSELGDALLLLARHSVRLVPPVAWLAASVLGLSWIILMQHLWSQS